MFANLPGKQAQMRHTMLALAVTCAAGGALATPVGAAETTKRAVFGKAQTLQGIKQRLTVRPYKIENATPGEFEEPKAGTRLVAVRVSLKNVGRSTYSDSPSNGAKLVTAGGRAINTTISVGGSCDTSTASGTRIPRGQKRLICLAFEVPIGARIRYFEFVLNSGFADQLGQWRRVPQP